MGHDHDDHTEVDDGQPAVLPPEPDTRHITPAPEDFASPPGLGSLLWPVFWILMIAVLWAVVASNPADSYFKGEGAGEAHTPVPEADAN